MITLEIEPNSNCDAVELRVFHDLEPPKPVSHVRIMKCQTLLKAGEVSDTSPEWHRVTGWTREGAQVPAQARKVDDSGEGIVWLITGGDAGLRLQPDDRGGTVHAAEGVPQQAGAAAGPQQAWRLEDANQWGTPFLLMGEPGDLRFLESA